MNLLVVTNDFDVSVSPEALELKAFKALVTRDKGSKGDADGRKKYRAKKEFAFIYHMVSADSPYSGFEKSKRQNTLIKDLFGEEEWKMDAEVLEALNLYQRITTTGAIRVLQTLRDSLNTTDDVIQKLITNIQERIKSEDYKKIVTNRVGTPISGISLIMDDLTSLIKLSNEIPKTLDVIEKQEEKAKLEKKENSGRAKGGKSIGDRER